MFVNQRQIFVWKGAVERGVEEFTFCASEEDRVLSSPGETTVGVEQKGDIIGELWQSISRGPSNRAQRTKAAVRGRLGRTDWLQMTVKKNKAHG